jgi:hypothetical protein
MLAMFMSAQTTTRTTACALMLLSAVLISTGCSREESHAESGDSEASYVTDVVTPGFKQTIVFVDASASAQASDYTAGVFERQLALAVDSSLSEPDDRLSIFPVHEHTISKVGQWGIVNQVELPHKKDFENEQDQEIGFYYGSVQQFKRKAKAEVQEQASLLRSNQAYRNWTDLWGTIEVASDEIDTTAAQINLIYFSDMFESVQEEGRHDFDHQPPSSRQEAAEWALMDAERLTDFVTVDRRALSQARVQVVLGDMGTKEGGNHVKHYWETLFEALGVKEVVYN